MSPPVPQIAWQSWAALLWLIAVLIMLGLLIQRACFARSLIRQSKTADEDLLSQLARNAARIGIRRQVDIRLSPNATSPSVCNLVKPVILMPEGLYHRLSKSQIDAILLHELAHIQRGDLWVNLFQSLLQIIYFYHPLLWIANATIRRVREQAVDERVLVAMDQEAEVYPETLLHVSKLIWSKPMRSLGSQVFNSTDGIQNLSVTLKSTYLNDNKTSIGHGIEVVMNDQSLRIPNIEVDTPNFLASRSWSFFDHSSTEKTATIKIEKRYGKPYAELHRLAELHVFENFDSNKGIAPRIWMPGEETTWYDSDAYFIQVYMIPVSQLEELHIDAPYVYNRRLRDGSLQPGLTQLPDGSCLPTDASKEACKAVSQRYLDYVKGMTVPIPKLTAHQYYKLGEPIKIEIKQIVADWQPSLSQLAEKYRGFFSLLNGKEYDPGHLLGSFGGTTQWLSMPNDVPQTPGIFRMAYGWKDIDVINPDKPNRSIHFDRLMTNEVKFEIVDELPFAYYKEVYETGWDEILHNSIEPWFTDDFASIGVAGSLLGLKVGPLPFDIAFDVYAQAEDMNQPEYTCQLARKANSPGFDLRWLILLDWLAEIENASSTSQSLLELAKTQNNPQESNLTKMYAAVVLARDGLMDQAIQLFTQCTPEQTPQWGWFVFEMNIRFNAYVEQSAPNVTRREGNTLIQEARTKEQWHAIETPLRKAQTAYADYLEHQLLPLTADYITSNRAKDYEIIDRIQITDSLRNLNMDRLRSLRQGSSTDAKCFNNRINWIQVTLFESCKNTHQNRLSLCAFLAAMIKTVFTHTSKRIMRSAKLLSNGTSGSSTNVKILF